VKEYLRSNCTLVSASRKLKNTGLEFVIEAFSSIKSNVNIVGRAYMELSESSEFYYKNPNEKKVAFGLIKDFDLGIQDIAIESINLDSLPDHIKMKIKEDKPELFDEERDGFLAVDAIHSYGGKEYTLPLFYESDGTLSLYNILRYIVPVLISGGVAVIDELESGLHPLMVEKIVKLFLDPATNKGGGQLIFSTHSVGILELLDSNQVTLIEKDEETGSSDIYRLSDIKNVLPRDNFYKQYLSGRYGATPEF
jgi:hypothetical protein